MALLEQVIFMINIDNGFVGGFTSIVLNCFGQWGL
jgi:hypothetical protein